MLTGRCQGRVVRPVSGESLGMILTPKLPAVRATFNADSSGSPDLEAGSLEVEDEVEFDLLDNMQSDLRIARKIGLLCKGREKINGFALLSDF